MEPANEVFRPNTRNLRTTFSVVITFISLSLITAHRRLTATIRINDAKVPIDRERRTADLPDILSVGILGANKTFTDAKCPAITRCAGNYDYVTGDHREEICAYLMSLFSSKTRFSEPEEKDLTPIMLSQSIVPVCTLSLAQHNTENVEFSFSRSRRKKIFASTDGEHRLISGAPAIRRRGNNSLTVTVWPKGSKHPAFDVDLPAEYLSNGGDLDPLKHMLFEKELLPDHLWPSGSIFATESGVIAAVHQKMYKVGIFKGKKAGNMERVPSTGFLGIGGENIGTLFQHGNRLLLAARYNIPHHIHGMSGHGHRQAGVFELLQCVDERQNKQVVHGELLMQHSFDEQCCKLCGGCVEDMDFSSCSVNSTAWWNCKKQPEEADGRTVWSWSLKFSRSLDMTCFDEATGTGCEVLREFYRCSHECRRQNEIYQSGVTVHNGIPLGTLASRESNKLFLCRLSETLYRYYCLPNAILELNSSKATHPVMSGLVSTLKELFLIEVFASKAPRGEIPPTYILHSWPADDFCSAKQVKTSKKGSIKVKLVSSHRKLGIIFTPNKLDTTMNCSITSTNVDVSFISTHGRQKIDYTVQVHARSACMAVFSADCEKPCWLLIEFSDASLHGMVAVTPQH